jgi:hypothetical protein
LRGVVVPLFAVLAGAAFAAVWADGGAGCAVRGVMGTVKVYNARAKADRNNVATWPDARVGMALRENDMIATLAESEARIETRSGNEVRLKENTVVEVARLSGDGAVAKVKVGDGSVVATVKKVVGGKGAFEVETPTALAAIRGTTVEVDSRKGAGTTVKTFDGTVQVSPKGVKKPAPAAVGHYGMTEVAPGQTSVKARDIPKFYKQKTTKLLSEENAAALTGFSRVILTMSELEEVQNRLVDDGIVCGVGVGEASDEMTARKVSSDAARTELAKSMDTRVQRLSESYAQNAGGEAKKFWEEGVRQITSVSVRGSSVHTTITQFNADKKIFKVYSLMIIQPWRTKGLFAGLVDRGAEEAELRVKKDEMMDKLDGAIRAYNTRYHDR